MHVFERPTTTSTSPLLRHSYGPPQWCYRYFLLAYMPKPGPSHLEESIHAFIAFAASCLRLRIAAARAARRGGGSAGGVLVAVGRLSGGRAKTHSWMPGGAHSITIG